MQNFPEWTLIIFRSFLYILILIFITRMLGKKQISEITFFEYISGITIGSIAGEVIMGLDRNIMHGVLAILVFGAITYLVDYITLKSKKFRDMVEGKSSPLIKDGKILEDNLKKEKYTLDDLQSLLRGKNVFNTAEVEFAVLEPNGDLSVLLKKEYRPLTPKDLNLNVANDKEPQTVIMDGQILDNALSSTGKDRGWLSIELAKQGVTLDNVFCGQVNSYGDLTIDIYDDKLTIPAPQERPMLLAMIKKCQADLEAFALETDSETGKQMYLKNAEKIKGQIDKLTPYLK
ncbi:DUF421 domain-containing protein [Neobacillus sp. LXY-4]|uniref:DUF421 domain-containing protein n=1 Tax=Neobacillus sp. LXY-4 TaxID=3379826 RepID=UPI003EE3C0CD